MEEMIVRVQVKNQILARHRCIVLVYCYRHDLK